MCKILIKLQIVLFSLSERHQILQAYLTSGSLYGSAIDIIDCNLFNIELYNQEIEKVVTTSCILNDSDKIYQSFKIIYKGATYKNGDIIIVGMTNLKYHVW